jgi:hypothetical protein
MVFCGENMDFCTMISGAENMSLFGNLFSPGVDEAVPFGDLDLGLEQLLEPGGG